jgi:hypothetical protein
MTQKEMLVKAIVHVDKRWAESTGAGHILSSAYPSPDATVLVIPATYCDIGDPYFVVVVFWPRALADMEVKSVKAFIPKEAVKLIVELKPEAIPALGYKAS